MWLKVYLIQLHQKYVFRKYFPIFRKKLENCDEISDDLLRKIVYGWGNMGFSSEHLLAKAVIHYINHCIGPVLECGSGLSTIIMGIVAIKKNIKVYSLEHHQDWHRKISSFLAKERLNNSILYYTPLKSYESYDWYDIHDINLPKDFDLILCDGPPGQTRGGRFGLVPQLNEKIKKNAIILVDDYSRSQEKDTVEKWKTHYQYTILEDQSNDVFATLLKQ